MTFIAPGQKVVGIITGKAEALIEGEVEGEVTLDSQVVVGQRGRVKGNITARSVRIAGKLIGNVTGMERIELTASASLEGNVAAPSVVIAEGAFFKGQVEMTQKGASVSPQKSAAAPPSRPSADGSSRGGRE